MSPWKPLMLGSEGLVSETDPCAPYLDRLPQQGLQQRGECVTGGSELLLVGPT